MTGFATPPSTTDSTTPPFKCVPGQDFYHPQMEYTRAMDTIEKVYCFTIKLVNYCTGHDNNDALVAALASKNNCDPMAMAAIPLVLEL